jgi:hypothetical protein
VKWRINSSDESMVNLSKHFNGQIAVLMKKYYSAINATERIYISHERISQNSMERTMGWVTLYITGKGDFREEVRHQLEKSDLDVMPGYTGIVSAEEVHDLYWVDEKTDVRTFKEAIGSKLIWKYRLRFFPSFEAFIESQNKEKAKKPELTPEDLALLAEIKSATNH